MKILFYSLTLFFKDKYDPLDLRGASVRELNTNLYLNYFKFLLEIIFFNFKIMVIYFIKITI